VKYTPKSVGFLSFVIDDKNANITW
jgi:hypothetical protein